MAQIGMGTSARPIATYSIVARHDDGSLGVAVQSHWFNVGGVVPWIESGVGAVVAQAFSPPAQAARILDLLRAKLTPDQALSSELEDDPDVGYRQLGVVSAEGDVGAHTGALCIPEAGHRLGEGFSTQANLMERATVWDAMANAYVQSKGDFADCLLAALDAAEASGGDIRGRQSAAIVIVGPPMGIKAPLDRKVDLRVEDHPQPLQELRRLVSVRRAYALLNEGDQLLSADEPERAVAAYEEAMRILPPDAANGEAAFWTGVALASVGRAKEAGDYLSRAQAVSPIWSRLLPRLREARLLSDDRLIERLVEEMQSAGSGMDSS